jgi:Fe2+ transport system protein B
MDFGLINHASAANIDTLIAKIDKVILNPAIGFIFALALVYFLYGIVQFLLYKEKGEVREEGKRHMIWGLVGMFIMISAYGIINFIILSIG